MSGGGPGRERASEAWHPLAAGHVWCRDSTLRGQVPKLHICEFTGLGALRELHRACWSASPKEVRSRWLGSRGEPSTISEALRTQQRAEASASRLYVCT